MQKLLIALLTAAFAASPALVAAQTTAPAKEEKKAEAKKETKKADAKKAEAKQEEQKKETPKKKPKGGC
jgi:Ni/Co efflux regulator RcnB